MSQLAVVAVIMGCLVSGWHLLLAVWPQRARSWVISFPRSVWAGRILAAMDVAWVCVLLLHSDIKWVERHQFLVLLMAPVALALIVVFVDDLLAARALGGLFLLAPAPILSAAFVHPSASRLVMTLFAYMLVIVGIVWVWSPFMFRKMTARWTAGPRLSRAVGLAGCLAGLVMILLGFIVY